MTWAKFGTQFTSECAERGLTDAEFRTHAEAIIYLYEVESMDLHIQKHLVRRWAGSDYYEEAIHGLVQKGLWAPNGNGYRVVHHADIIRQSLGYQIKKREQDKARQQKRRARDAGDAMPDVTRDVTRDVAETQSIKHTNKQEHLSGDEYIDENGEVHNPSAAFVSNWNDSRPWTNPMEGAA